MGARCGQPNGHLWTDDAELRAIARRLVRIVIFATVHNALRLTGSYIENSSTARCWTFSTGVSPERRLVSNEEPLARGGACHRGGTSAART